MRVRPRRWLRRMQRRLLRLHLLFQPMRPWRRRLLRLRISRVRPPRRMRMRRLLRRLL